MGVSGAGKSEVGRRLAARLGVAYVDGDELHPDANIAAMRGGRALSDDDRRPWLERVADWLADHDHQGGVVSCSALRRSYRDVLVDAAPRTVFLYLTGDPELLAERMAGRSGHFMPRRLLASQLATLEPPAPDEPHVVIDVAAAPDAIVEAFLKAEVPPP